MYIFFETFHKLQNTIFAIFTKRIKHTEDIVLILYILSFVAFLIASSLYYLFTIDQSLFATISREFECISAPSVRTYARGVAATS